jgi:uncharacterized protein (DUF736 family)
VAHHIRPRSGRRGRRPRTRVAYLSVKLDDPSLPAPILANLFEMDGGEFELIWSRPNGNRSRE